SLHIVTRSRVVSLGGTPSSVWPISKCAARIRAGTRVVSGAESSSTVRSIYPSGGAKDSRVRVVPGAVSVSPPVRVIDRVVAAIPVVRRVIPARSPNRATPADHHSGITGRRSIGNPFVIGIFVLLNGHIGHTVGRRVGRNLINLWWHCLG